MQSTCPSSSVAQLRLRSGQDKHVRDIRSLIMGCSDRIDHAMVEHWVQSERLRVIWRDCRQRPGEEQ